MLDQSFSTENFRKILDYENRKGVYLEGMFFPEVKIVSEKIKKLNIDLRKVKRFPESHPLLDSKQLFEQKEAAELQKEELLVEQLEAVRDLLLKKDFKFSLIKNEQFSDKPIYTVAKNPSNFFALKQIQYNFRKLYKVKQSNRFAILSHLKSLLNDGFPKFVIRTDIKDFYETIPHDVLINKLNEENLLTFSSKKIIYQIFKEYKRLSGQHVGLPRGIGISAYLAELYMRDVDKSIKSLPTVSYYARYVDDIIIIFTPQSENRGNEYLDDIKTIIESKHQLKINSSKTKLLDFTQDQSSKTLEYLGYKITFGGGDISFKLSSHKIARYKQRIKLAINSYQNFSKVDEKFARNLLVKRIKFLTGNTRLLNNKKNILVGVFYSNNLLTSEADFVALDRFYANEVSKIANNVVERRLLNYSFKNGFLERRFSPFNASDLSDIFKIWKEV